MRQERGVTVIELAVVLAVLAAGIGLTAPSIERVLPNFRVKGAAADIYGALHLARARARATGVMHALVIEGDGHAFRIVEDPTGEGRTVVGPSELVGGVVVSSNTTIRFSAQGYVVPTGTITIRSEDEMRRVIVNILGRVRMDSGPPTR